jgi:hypothetical protein
MKALLKLFIWNLLTRLNNEQMHRALNRELGLFGISGESSVATEQAPDNLLVQEEFQRRNKSDDKH